MCDVQLNAYTYTLTEHLVTLQLGDINVNQRRKLVTQWTWSTEKLSSEQHSITNK